MPPLGSDLWASWGHVFGFWAVLAPKLAPSWEPKSTKNRSKRDAKNDQNLNASWKPKMLEKIRFGRPKWNQVGRKIASKIDLNLEKRFYKNRAPARAGARKIGFGGFICGAKSNQKSTSKAIPKRNGLGTPFFGFGLDFGAILASQNGAKRVQNRC